MFTTRSLLIGLLCFVTPLAVYGQDEARKAYQEGNAAFEAFDYPTALTHFDKALALDFSNADIYLKRGQIYWFSLRHERAVEDLTRALDLDPDLMWAYYFRGISLLNLQRFDDGTADLSRVTGPGALPEDFRVRALRFRAIGYMNLERYREAAEDLTTCIDLDANQPLFFFERGALYEALGRTEAAIADYEVYLEKHPEATEQTKMVRQRLATLREGLN